MIMFLSGCAINRSRFKSAIDSSLFQSLPRIPINKPCDVSEEIKDEEIIIRTSVPGIPSVEMTDNDGFSKVSIRRLLG